MLVRQQSIHVRQQLQECALFFDKCRSDVTFLAQSVSLFLVCVCVFISTISDKLYNSSSS